MSKAPAVALEEYSYRFRLTSGKDWLMKALRQLGKDIGATGVPHGAIGVMGPGTSKPVEVGLDVRAVRKVKSGGYPATALTVSAAAFDGAGALVGWSTDLDESYPQDSKVHFYDPKTNRFFVLEDRKRAAEIQAGPSGKAKPAGKKPSASPGKTPSASPGMKHQGDVLGLAFTADGARIVSIGVDGLARIFDAERRTEVASIRIGKVVQRVATAPRGALAAAAATKITIFSSETGAKLADARGHGSSQDTTGLAFAGEHRLISAGASTVVIWDAKTGQPLHDWKAARGEDIVALAVSPDQERIAVATTGSLYVLDAGQLTSLASAQVEPSEALEWTKAGIAATYDGGIAVYDPTTLKEQRRIETECEVSFVADGSREALITLDRYETHRIERVPLAGGPSAHIADTKDGSFLAASPDGRWIALATGPRIELLQVPANR